MYDANGTVLSSEELIPAASSQSCNGRSRGKVSERPDCQRGETNDKDGMRYEIVLKVSGKNKSVEVEPSGEKLNKVANAQFGCCCLHPDVCPVVGRRTKLNHSSLPEPFAIRLRRHAGCHRPSRPRKRLSRSNHQI